MAFYDNKFWILSHISNSFISADDTGMSEIVLTTEDLVKQLPRQKSFDTYPSFDDNSDDDDDLNINESYEMNYLYTGVGGLSGLSNFRNRSDTAQYLEKMNTAKKKQVKTKTIKWEMPQKNLSEEELNDMFSKKKLVKSDSELYQQPSTSSNAKMKKVISKFSQMMVQEANKPRNPFVEFSKFDGSGRLGMQIRKFKIFLAMLPENERNYPLNILFISTGRVIDLIGLILLKYSMVNPNFQFKSITSYQLYITEEDGEIDPDFPPLEHNELITKYSFSTLGLVETEKNKSDINLRFKEFPQTNIGESMFPYLNEDKKGFGQVYFPKPNRDNEYLARMREHNFAMEALIYQTYKVYIIHKIRGKIEVNLGISGEKIEIDPVQHKNTATKLWLRQKALCYKMDSVASCEIVEISKHNRTLFKLIYNVAQFSNSFPSTENAGARLFGANVSHQNTSSHTLNTLSSNFKHHDFEAEQIVAEEIVHKINKILEIRSSISHKEYKLYLTLKAKKALGKHRFYRVSS